MARALVVFESIFGDNQVLAQAIAHGLSTTMAVEVVAVDSAPLIISDDIDLLVVGGPTHMARMTKARSRMEIPKISQGELGVPESGVREWLESLQRPGGSAIKAAAFGTNMAEPTWVKKMGRAARGISRRLSKKGFDLIGPPQVFLVTDVKGPLVDGEEERARAWARDLATSFGESEMRPGH